LSGCPDANGRRVLRRDKSALAYSGSEAKAHSFRGGMKPTTE
jgi:hypothetical protein